MRYYAGQKEGGTAGGTCLPLFGKITFPVAQVIGSRQKCVYGAGGRGRDGRWEGWRGIWW